jgi:hypothetical protein
VTRLLAANIRCKHILLSTLSLLEVVADLETLILVVVVALVVY